MDMICEHYAKLWDYGSEIKGLIHVQLMAVDIQPDSIIFGQIPITTFTPSLGNDSHITYISNGHKVTPDSDRSVVHMDDHYDNLLYQAGSATRPTRPTNGSRIENPPVGYRFPHSSSSFHLVVSPDPVSFANQKCLRSSSQAVFFFLPDDLPGPDLSPPLQSAVDLEVNNTRFSPSPESTPPIRSLSLAIDLELKPESPPSLLRSSTRIARRFPTATTG
ncbi:hypothetical protein LXL04_024990 [Taraxacum kok-saghyz]